MCYFPTLVYTWGVFSLKLCTKGGECWITGERWYKRPGIPVFHPGSVALIHTSACSAQCTVEREYREQCEVYTLINVEFFSTLYNRYSSECKVISALQCKVFTVQCTVQCRPLVIESVCLWRTFPPLVLQWRVQCTTLLQSRLQGTSLLQSRLECATLHCYSKEWSALQCYSQGGRVIQCYSQGGRVIHSQACSAA